MINLTVGYHHPSSTVDSHTVEGAYLVEDQVVPNGVNGIAKRHVVVFRQKRIKKNKYMAMAAIFFVIVVLLIAGLIAGVYHPGFETERDNPGSSPSSSSSSSSSEDTRPPLSVTKSSQQSCGTRPGYPTRHRRVINGLTSELGQWPWQVFILEGGEYLCGGAIVSPEWVFTAAHCAQNLFNKKSRLLSSDITVVAGSLHREEYDEINAQVRTATRHIVHPDYAKERAHYNYDIMLLRLNKPFEINDNVRTICLESLPAMELYAPGKTCVVAGWGYTTRRNWPSDQAVRLVYAEIPLIDKEECHSFVSGLGRRQELQITPQRLCAGYEDNRQLVKEISVPCKGDSGSPLVCEDSSTGLWHLTGLVSSGPKCGEVAYFTNVSAVADFWKVIYNDTALPPADFPCRDGNRTVPTEWLCDGEPDCEDMSDETQCECTSRQFQCDNGMCLQDIYRCDALDQCGDGSDERGCAYFNCSDHADGQRVAASTVCDGHFDCENTMDESNDICEYDPTTHFACAEGIRIPHGWVCDGYVDCSEEEDEKGCNCSSHQFQCDDRCILRDHVCDNQIDCEDMSDEINCTCSGERFMCEATGLCWEKAMALFCTARSSCVDPPGQMCDLMGDVCGNFDFHELCMTMLSSLPDSLSGSAADPTISHSNGTDIGNGG